MCAQGREESRDVACLDFTLKAKLASHLLLLSHSLQKAPGAKHQSCLRQKEMLCVIEGPGLRGKSSDLREELVEFFLFCSHCHCSHAGLPLLLMRAMQQEA